MRHASALALAMGLAGVAHAIKLGDGSSSYKPVKFGITRKQLEKGENRRRDEPDDTAEVTLDSFRRSKYFAEGTVGTPGQKVSLQIDTGSSDMWVNYASSSLCSTGKCDQYGVYDPTKSSSKALVNNNFKIGYVDGSSAVGAYITETVNFDDITIDKFQLGLAEKSSSPSGVLGVGFVENEASVTNSNAATYPNFPQRLVDDGVIATNAYSLYLNDLDAKTGNILFGGVDKGKFNGELVTVPMIPSEGGSIREVRLSVTKVAIDGDKGVIYDGQGIGMVLDSGATLSYLPPAIAAEIIQASGAQRVSSQIYAVDCSAGQYNDTIDFTFDNKVTIKVPVNEMVVQFGQQCILGVAVASDPTSVILGDTFLRSAYVVYDLSNKEISLAQTNFFSEKTDIVAIEAGSDGAPDATGTPQDEVTSSDFGVPWMTVPTAAVAAGAAIAVGAVGIL